MEKVGFIGACDKTNLIMYVAKALTSLQKKVLVVDSTIEQKTKYIVPAINPTKSYIIDFEKIDFAVGFYDFQEIQKYLGVKVTSLPRTSGERQDKKMTEILTNANINEPSENLPYDYILINIDSAESIKKFDIGENLKNYFVTTFDMFSLRKGVDILLDMKESLKLTKILYNYDMKKEDEEYLNFLSMDSKVIWNDTSVYLPRTDEDNEVIEENQRVFRIRIKKLSPEYQEGIFYITQDILGDENMSKIRKSIKE